MSMQTNLFEEGKEEIPEDPTRYFKCYRCHRRVDRREEPMMQFSGGNQTFGLQRPFHSYCWGCYWIVKRESKGKLAGLTGREFACVVTERINDRRKKFI